METEAITRAPRRGRPPAARGARPEMRQDARIFRPDDDGFGNPFDGMLAPDVLPYVPDTDKYAYQWVRVELGGAADGSNLVNHLNGRLRYEIVPPEEMPHLAPLSAKTAQVGDCIRVMDVVLMRTDRRMRDLYMAAVDKESARRIAQIRPQVQDAFRGSERHGVKLHYEDREDSGVRDGRDDEE